MAYLEWTKTGRCYIRDKRTRTRFPVIDSNGSTPSKSFAKRALAEYQYKESRLAMGLDIDTPHVDARIAAMAADYLAHAAKHYGTSTQNGIVKCAIDALVATHGKLRPAEYTPDHMRRLRSTWRDKSRQTAQHYTAAVKRFFRWCVAEHGMPQSVVDRLVAAVYEPVGVEADPVPPVDWARQVEPLQDYLTPMQWTIVQVQYLTGSRPGEWLAARIGNINVDGPVVDGVQMWSYAPSKHKTAHRGKRRVILCGPRVQDLLRGYMLRPRTAYLFPLGGRSDRGCYDTRTYAQFVERACIAAGVEPWSPNQLRHARATDISARWGQQYAGAVAGHARSRTTDVYDDAGILQAAKVMATDG